MSNMLQVDDSETEDDEISATRYIASREAPTPVRPTHGRKWGKRMPSPFDTPTPAEAEPDQEGEEEEDLAMAPSCASSDFDPSGNPVHPIHVSA